MSRAIVVLPTPGGPEYAAVRAARLEGKTQRHALSQHMLLANDFGQRARPQALGQGLMGNGRR